jgi:hypothetical protein
VIAGVAVPDPTALHRVRDGMTALLDVAGRSGVYASHIAPPTLRH